MGERAVRERPILFSAPMVRAIRAGTKTQTRRICKLASDGMLRGGGVCTPLQDGVGPVWSPYGNAPLEPLPSDRIGAMCPYGAPGDRLWVRETWKPTGLLAGAVPRATRACGRFAYAADPKQLPRDAFIRWRPSIHMPRWASRITLEVTEVRVQRLQDIDGHDAIAEGIQIPRCSCEVCRMSAEMCPADQSAAIQEFAALWNSINGKRPGCSWENNPWVWCVSFTEVTRG